MRVATIGLGYVGEPLARALHAAGHEVTGFDIDPVKVANIQAGRTNIPGEPGLVDIPWTNATTDPAHLADHEAYIIAVSIPLAPNANNYPDFRQIRSAVDLLTEHAPDGALVIVESTCPPGTMRSECHNLAPQFRWAHIPERVTAGKALANLRTMPRVIGTEEGHTPGTPMNPTAAEVVSLYRTIGVTKFAVVDWTSAEISKCAENAQRDLLIGFANELALITEEHGGNFEQVKAAIESLPGREVLEPGLGVGGGCLPKDGWLLLHGTSPGAATLIPGARLVNESMPHRFADIIQQEVGRSGRILILGEAYMPGSPDTRESPTHALIDALNESAYDRGYDISVIDPYTGRDDGPIGDGNYDCIVLATAHPENLDIPFVDLADTNPDMVIVDGRGAWNRAEVEAAGLRYFSLS